MKFVGLGEIPEVFIGVSEINKENIHIARKNLERNYSVPQNGAVVILQSAWINIEEEISSLMKKHEMYLGLRSRKIFLSHKSVDKPIVREFKLTLDILGFETWLDETAMHAGVELERALLKGFEDSCAAIFFITPDFLDEKYLSTEVNYAIQQKREKANDFSIITLILEQNGRKGVVPSLLKQFVWKEPKSELEALRIVLSALPLELGDIRAKVT